MAIRDPSNNYASSNHQDDLGREFLKIQRLMDMVIHDLRVPTVSIKQGLKQALGKIHQISLQIHNQVHFGVECKKVLNQLQMRQSLDI